MSILTTEQPETSPSVDTDCSSALGQIAFDVWRANHGQELPSTTFEKVAEAVKSEVVRHGVLRALECQPQRLENAAYTFSFAGMIANVLANSADGVARYATGILMRMFVDRLTGEQCEEAMKQVMRRYKEAIREPRN